MPLYVLHFLYKVFLEYRNTENIDSIHINMEILKGLGLEVSTDDTFYLDLLNLTSDCDILRDNVIFPPISSFSAQLIEVHSL